MPIRRELRPLYPPHWRELSARVRFERAGGRCQGCGRPHLVRLRCLPDGRWFDEAAGSWRDRRGRPARWPDLVEATRLRTTRVVLAAAHLDSDPTNNRLRNLRAQDGSLNHLSVRLGRSCYAAAMTKQRSAARSAPPPGHDSEARLSPFKAERVSAALEWQVTGEDLRSAEARLDIGGVVHLSVECLGSTGWDWLVWDSSCQALPRYGLAGTEGAAKRRAEASMLELNAVLHDLLGRIEAGAADGSP